MAITIEHLKRLTKIKKKIIIMQTTKELESNDYHCEVCGGECRGTNPTYPGMNMWECNECGSFMSFINGERVINDDKHFM